MGKEGSTSKLAPGQEPDAIIMDDEQQWPEDAGVPEYADEHGAFGDNVFRYSLLSMAACEAPLHLNIGGFRSELAMASPLGLQDQKRGYIMPRAFC